MSTLASSHNPWPGLQLRPGVVFFWAAGDESSRTIFQGQFEGYGKEIKTEGGTDHPAAKFKDVQVSSDYGKSWQPTDAKTFPTHNTFYTSKDALLLAIMSS